MSVEPDNDKLWEAYMNSHEPHLKDEIVKRFLPLVRYVASRMSVRFPPSLDFEDILSFGALGLLDAIERFEPKRSSRDTGDMPLPETA